MDKSPEYIKQCEKASPDYCPTWKWQQGDFAYSLYHRQVGVIEETGQYFRTKTLSVPLLGGVDYDKIIPLPRQDQLQEMVSGKVFGEATSLVHWAYSWNDTIYQQFQFTSMEQFWLAFVMKEKFGKVWNGTDWVKE